MITIFQMWKLSSLKLGDLCKGMQLGAQPHLQSKRYGPRSQEVLVPKTDYNSESSAMSWVNLYFLDFIMAMNLVDKHWRNARAFYSETHNIFHGSSATSAFALQPDTNLFICHQGSIKGTRLWSEQMNENKCNIVVPRLHCILSYSSGDLRQIYSELKWALVTHSR